MDQTVQTHHRNNPTAEMLLFAISMLAGLIGLSVFATLLWEYSTYRNGLSDKLVPMTVLAAFIAFPIALVVSKRLYQKCRDTFSRSLLMVVIVWQSLLFLAWCISVFAMMAFIYAWLTGDLMWHGEKLSPPSWSSFF